MIQSSPELALILVTATIGVCLGLAVGFYLEDIYEAVHGWWTTRNRRARAKGLRRMVREQWGLTERQAELAATAHRRWSEGRCAFCGYDHAGGERRRCEAQVAYIRETGRTTWEESNFHRIVDHVYGEDRDLEAVG